MEDTKMARYAAEFVGTYVLVLSVGCNILSANWMAGPMSVAAIYIALVYATAGVSGGYLNPAVALSAGVAGKLPMSEVAAYCGLEVAGGMFGALTYNLLFWQNFTIGPMHNFKWWQVGCAEAMYTFMLCFVFLNCAVVLREKGGQFYGLAVGFALVAGAYGAGAISGGCFNPALALSIDLSSVRLGFGWSCCYVGSELIGAALAGALFRVVRPEELGLPVPKGPVLALIGEFVGTFLFALTVGLNIYAGSGATAFSAAAAMTAMVFSLWDVSGAHFNPAVTLAVVVSGAQRRNQQEGLTKVVVGRALSLVLAQLAAGICAMLVCCALYDGASYPLGPPRPYSFRVQACVEVMFTTLLCFVVLSTATDRTQKMLTQYVGLAIGLCVMAGSYVVHVVAGGTMNPALTVGVAMTTSPMLSILNLLLLIGSELAGAGLAAALLRMTHPSAYRPNSSSLLPQKQ